jgi:predicted DNA-binding transcriptional regulator YafY
MAHSFARGKQTARQFKVLQLLENSRFGLSTRELRNVVVDELGLSSLHEKTIKRDIEHWCNLGYAIQQVELDNLERPKVWKLDRALMKAPKLPIGVVELLAFSAGRELLYPLAGTPYWDGIQRLWERMCETTSPEVLDHLRRQQTGLVVRGPVPKNYSKQEGMLSSLNRAVYEHRTAEVNYKGLGKQPRRKRRIDPHAICLFNNSIYILAADADKAESPMKTYKLDRISSVEILDQRFAPKREFDPQEYFDNSIGIFRNGRPQKFRIRVSAERADLAIESLHPKQTVEHRADGSVTIEIEAAYEEEILPIVLSLGEHAEVLIPKSSRENLLSLAKDLVNRYSG